MKNKSKPNGGVGVMNGADEAGEQQKRWEKETLNPSLEKLPERDVPFTTISGVPIRRLYTPADTQDINFEKDISWPGEYPYTRGIHPTMYRSRIYSMRQFTGFGTAKQTNERLRYLTSAGTNALSVAFQLPTLMGRDSDHEYSKGEVGKCGVVMDSLRDMEILFDGIRQDHGPIPAREPACRRPRGCRRRKPCNGRQWTKLVGWPWRRGER